MINNIQLNKLIPHPNNPRKDLGDLKELTDSIKKNGVMQNLTAVPTKDPNKYMVVIGHRRLAAAKLADLIEVPCAIVEMEENKQLATMLLENMQRSDLTILEQAQGFQMMMDLGETITDISEQTGFAQSTIYKRTNLLKLNQDEVKKGMLKGATLLDFEKLNQLKDEKNKEEAIKCIGTSNFDFVISERIKKEKAAIEKQKLIEIIEKDPRFQNVETGNNLSFVKAYNEWTGYKILPELEEDKKYYYSVGSNWLTIYQENEEDDNEDKNEAGEDEQGEKKTELSNQIKQKEVTMRELRKTFVRKLTVPKIKKNITHILKFYIWLTMIYKSVVHTDNFYFFSYDCEYAPREFEEEKREEIKEEPEKTMFHLIASSIERRSWSTESYINHFETYSKNEKLEKWYELLELLGYQCGTEELQIRNGTHELFAKIKELEE